MAKITKAVKAVKSTVAKTAKTTTTKKTTSTKKEKAVKPVKLVTYNDYMKKKSLTLEEARKFAEICTKRPLNKALYSDKLPQSAHDVALDIQLGNCTEKEIKNWAAFMRAYAKSDLKDNIKEGPDAASHISFFANEIKWIDFYERDLLSFYKKHQKAKKVEKKAETKVVKTKATATKATATKATATKATATKATATKATKQDKLVTYEDYMKKGKLTLEEAQEMENKWMTKHSWPIKDPKWLKIKQEWTEAAKAKRVTDTEVLSYFNKLEAENRKKLDDAIKRGNAKEIDNFLNYRGQIRRLAGNLFQIALYGKVM